MALDPHQRATAQNWIRAQVERKQKEQKREEEYLAKHPAVHSWKVKVDLPPPGVLVFGDIYLIVDPT
jgi:hypothetical protein